jgi:quercetin dioxygenase-like cupin family protein
MKAFTRLALTCIIVAMPHYAFQAQAQEGPAPTIVLPGSLKMAAGPVGEGITVGVAAGDPRQAGSNYVLYVQYAAGAKSIPHTHGDQRVMTVIAGTFYAGAGPKFDEAKATPLKPGSMIIVPPNSVHWGWAKDGEVILEEVGIGPSTTVPWPTTATK